MNTVLIAIVISAIAYLFGGMSTSRFVAKTFRSMNIERIGTGLADTENIFCNVSKILGVVVGAIDVAKSYVFLLSVKMVAGMFAPTLAGTNYLLIFGCFLLVGHCLPLTHHLRGGRGIFTYIGIVGFFAWLPILISAMLAWIVIFGYKQIRFGQYMIVILPFVLNLAILSLVPNAMGTLTIISSFPLVLTAIIMAILNVIVSKKLGEI